MRALTSGVLGAATSNNAETVHLVELDFSTGTVRLSTGAQDLDWNTFSWQGIGGQLELGGIQETNDAQGQGLDLRISGVDQTVLAVLLGSQYRGRVARIYRAYLDPSTGTIIDAPLLLFQGLQLSPYQVQESQGRTGGTVTISTRLSGYFGVEHAAGIQTNVPSHARFYPGDTFFQQVASLTNASVYWATKVASGIAHKKSATP